MVWGCVVDNKLRPIVFIDEKINTNVYIRILHDNMFPFIDAIAADRTTDIMFQQDNTISNVRQLSWITVLECIRFN